jgi:pyridoxine 5-phosphate synthase
MTKSHSKRRLGVNIDHVATLRRLRDTPYPDILRATRDVIRGGAEQITVHLREDRRHIVDADVRNIAALLRAEYRDVDLNLEMAATEAMLRFALEIRPFSICVVPEKREERTTEGGLDLSSGPRADFLQELTARAKEAGILVSFFIEPDAKDIDTSLRLGAQAVELHTGSLCIAHQGGKGDLAHEWQRVRSAVAHGAAAGALVHAGHGIDYNIAAELGAIKEIREYNIGHAIICEATFVGLVEATHQMKMALGLE